jgi:pimeloyl-ACP methyl ester carboxylesterase
VDTIISSDGTGVRVYDQGDGPAILIVGPGLDDGSRTKKLADFLAKRFRAIRLCRRQYRLDLKTDGEPCSMTQEVDDVLALAQHVGPPLVIYGHSSGGTVALETLVASPSTFAGAVIFEPAIVNDTPLAGEQQLIITRARAALAAGKPGKAMAIFARDTVGLSAWRARIVGMLTVLVPRYRRLVPCQIDDLQAVDELGNRLDAYAKITVPTLLLGGDRSPARLTASLHALEQVMPNVERLVMHGLDHGADLKAPKRVAGIIEVFANKVCNRSG